MGLLALFSFCGDAFWWGLCLGFDFIGVEADVEGAGERRGSRVEDARVKRQSKDRGVERNVQSVRAKRRGKPR